MSLDLQRYCGKFYEIYRDYNPYDVKVIHEYHFINSNHMYFTTSYYHPYGIGEEYSSWYPTYKLQSSSYGYGRKTDKPMLLLLNGDQNNTMDYKIYYTDYDNYSIIGDNKNLIILSRTPKVPQKDMNLLFELARKNGFHISL